MCRLDRHFLIMVVQFYNNDILIIETLYNSEACMRNYSLISLMFAVGCTGEKSDIQQTSPPNVSIESHQLNDEVVAGYPEIFVAKIIDLDNNSDELSVEWTLDGQVQCVDSSFDDNERHSCEMVVGVDNSSVTVQVTDPDGNSVETSFTIIPVQTLAPLVELLEPLADGVYFANVELDLIAEVQDERDDIYDLGILWESSLDGVLNTGVMIDSDIQVSEGAMLTAGTHIISIQVEDRSGATAQDSVEIVVFEDNQPPNCTIVSPSNGDVIASARTQLFLGNINDLEQPFDQLTVEWFSDQLGLLGSTLPSPDGSVSMEYTDFVVGEHIITLRADDGYGGVCEVNQILSVQEAPNIGVSCPINGATYTHLEAMTTICSVSDAEDAPEDLVVNVYSSVDGFVFTGNADEQGVLTTEISSLSPGNHQMTFTVVDTAGLESEAQVDLVVNRPPTIQQLTFSPDPVFTFDDLLATAVADDADGNVVTIDYQWFENGVLTNNSGDTISPVDLQADDEWRVVVTPNDGSIDGDSQELTIIVSNTPPTVSNVQMSPTTGIYNDGVVNCSGIVADPDQSILPVYNWLINGTSYNGDSLNLGTTIAMPGDPIECIVSATDDFGITIADSVQFTIDNRMPTISQISVDNSNPTTNDVVNCTVQSSDPDGETLIESIEWTSANSVIGSGSELDLSGTVVMPGDVVTCTATVTDAMQQAAQDLVTMTIVNSLPVVDSFQMTPSNPTASDEVICSASITEPDGESTTTTIDVQLNGSQLVSQSANTVTVDLGNHSVAENDILDCVLTVEDASGGIETQTISTSVLSSLPVIDNHSITPTSVYTGTPLYCSATANDPNDGNISGSILYTWTINGFGVGSGSTFTPSINDSNVGDAVVCNASVTDSDGQTVSAEINATIENTSPVIQSVSFSPTPIYNDQDLTCTAVVDDPDETIIPAVEWTLGGSVIANGNPLDLSTTNALPSDSITCHINAVDSQGESDAATSFIAIGNRAPNVPTSSITWSGNSSYPVAGDTLSCSGSGTDPDGQVISYTHSWTSSSGQIVQGNTVVGGLVQGNTSWTCQTTASDGALTSIGTSDVQVSTLCTPDTEYETLSLGGINDAEFVRVCAGSDPLGRYSLTNDMMMLSSETTQGMFMDLMGYDPTTYGSQFGLGIDHPVYYVNWHMAADFSNAMTTRYNSLNGASLTDCYSCSNSGSDGVSCSIVLQCTGYHLPTEAEWEYAARADSIEEFWTPNGGGPASSSSCFSSIPIQDGVGNPSLDTYSWYCYNRYDSQYYNTDKPVGLKSSNGFGLYDMHGNLSEWTNDRWGCSFPVSSVDPLCVTVDSEYTIRGGDWTNNASFLRSSYRSSIESTYRLYKQGFRVVRQY